MRATLWAAGLGAASVLGIVYLLNKKQKEVLAPEIPHQEMLSLTDGIHRLQRLGFSENLSLDYDHFKARNGSIELYPEDFNIEETIRFEDNSDPDNQSILYAISSKDHLLKGLFVESYGLYSDAMSPAIIQKIRECRQLH